MRLKIYDREAAKEYAQKWALARNPAYFDFENIGGDCTSFASQCIYAGAKVMNYTPVVGWFYRTASDRTASWTGVEYLYNFLTSNNSVGPYARVATRREAEVGDIIQLGNYNDEFYHSLVITSIFPTIKVCAHTTDSKNRPLYTYNYETARILHIEGVRDW